MPCYKPLIRSEYRNQLYLNKNGKISRRAHVYSLRDFEEHLNIRGYENVHDYPEENIRRQLIPCGQCIGCRLEYSRQWANRGYLESLLHDENWFITLTYNDEKIYIPDFMKTSEGKIYYNDGSWKGCLRPRDLQLFFKRLRTKIGKFSYMACGEYGSEGERPHYHAILFGAHFEPDTMYNAKIINHEFYYQNRIIEECWTEEQGRGKTGESLGFSNISNATWNNIAYTARYITKKINGIYSEDQYCSKGQIKEFLRTSRKPAIGKEYFNLHQDEIYEKDEIIISNKNGVQKTRPPRYFDKLYEEKDIDDMDWLKRKRQLTAKEKQKVKDRTTSLTRKEQLEVEERSKKPQVNALKRSFESSVSRK